jgi:hypothetical protein
MFDAPLFQIDVNFGGATGGLGAVTITDNGVLALDLSGDFTVTHPINGAGVALSRICGPPK